jgi:hypothetical protein
MRLVEHVFCFFLAVDSLDRLSASVVEYGVEQKPHVFCFFLAVAGRPA